MLIPGTKSKFWVKNQRQITVISGISYDTHGTKYQPQPDSTVLLRALALTLTLLRALAPNLTLLRASTIILLRALILILRLFLGIAAVSLHSNAGTTRALQPKEESGSGQG